MELVTIEIDVNLEDVRSELQKIQQQVSDLRTPLEHYIVSSNAHTIEVLENSIGGRLNNVLLQLDEVLGKLAQLHEGHVAISDGFKNTIISINEDLQSIKRTLNTIVVDVSKLQSSTEQYYRKLKTELEVVHGYIADCQQDIIDLRDKYGVIISLFSRLIDIFDVKPWWSKLVSSFRRK